MSEDHKHKTGDMSPTEKEKFSAEQSKSFTMNMVKDLLLKEEEKFFAEQNRPFITGMQELKLEEKKDIVRWRKFFPRFISRFFFLQYFVIFGFLLLHGFDFSSFELNNYIFYILILGTSVPSYFLLQSIFKYIFSENR